MYAALGRLPWEQEQPNDYVIATGATYSVREFVEATFAHLGLDWQQYVHIDPRYFRPTEVDLLLGDNSKARQLLNWQPKVSFHQLIKMMVESDWKLARQERLVKENQGFIENRAGA